MPKRRPSLSTETAQAAELTPTRGEFTIGTGERRFTRPAALKVIRDEIGDLPATAIVVIRGKGGTKKYETEWWSSIPTEGGFLRTLSDDDLARYLYDLEEPSVLDIYNRTT